MVLDPVGLLKRMPGSFHMEGFGSPYGQPSRMTKMMKISKIRLMI